ncbi:MAG: hypothetical protein Q8M03_10940, partial [Legionella sp.]|nr:hypothetical protein [Legionella sp.]
MRRLLLNIFCVSILALVVAACSMSAVPTVPDQAPDYPIVRQSESLRIAVLDHHLLGDLSDPAVMAKYARADLLITQ